MGKEHFSSPAPVTFCSRCSTEDYSTKLISQPPTYTHLFTQISSFFFSCENRSQHAAVCGVRWALLAAWQHCSTTHNVATTLFGSRLLLQLAVYNHRELINLIDVPKGLAKKIGYARGISRFGRSHLPHPPSLSEDRTSHASVFPIDVNSEQKKNNNIHVWDRLDYNTI